MFPGQVIVKACLMPVFICFGYQVKGIRVIGKYFRVTVSVRYLGDVAVGVIDVYGLKSRGGPHQQSGLRYH